MNTLTLKGNFSQGEMHSWISNCVPEVPEKNYSSDREYNLLVFRNVFVGTFLICKYSKGEAEFKSDNVSTISIIKDYITKEATTKHIKIELILSNNIKLYIEIHCMSNYTSLLHVHVHHLLLDLFFYRYK